MMLLIGFALLNGVLIATSRALNGRLAKQTNAFYSSWINHIVGFVVLTVAVLVLLGLPKNLSSVPVGLYFGGMIGALYVSLNSYVVPKLGITVATLLVIAGQMLMSLLLDIWLGKINWQWDVPLLLLIVGSVLLVYGFYQLLKSQSESS